MGIWVDESGQTSTVESHRHGVCVCVCVGGGRRLGHLKWAEGRAWALWPFLARMQKEDRGSLGPSTESV